MGIIRFTFLIDGDLTVTEGSVLSIDPGVQVQFLGHYELFVLGQLLAIGTAADSILFTAQDTLIGWRHIYIMANPDLNDTSKIAYCTVEYGKPSGGTEPGENTGGGIAISYANVIISHCLIRNNYCSGYHPISDPIGGGICVAFSDAIIEYTTITGNKSEGIGGGIGLARGCKPTIIHCTLSSNTTMADGGGIGSYNDSGFTLKNSIIEGSNGGSGIYIEDPDVINISYSEFYNNEDGDFSGYVPPGVGIIMSTNYNNDPCDLFFNIYLEPLFIDPENGDFHLSGDSPCIDAGDPSSPPDPDGSISDIGVFYCLQTYIKTSISHQTEHIKVYPNPIIDKTTIELSCSKYGFVSVTVSDINGKEIDLITSDNLQAGKHKFKWNAAGMPSGIYFCILKTADGVQSKKMIKLD